MLKSIFECNYMPSLCIRPSEMRALEELPEQDKDILFPYFMLSPWVGANDLSASIHRIEKAYGSRTFILGIDRYYPSDKLRTPAQTQFAQISSGSNNFHDYFEFVKTVEQAIPCAFLVRDDYIDLKIQIENLLKLGKGVVISIDKLRGMPSEELGRIIEQLPPNEFAIHICGGWSKDPLTDSLWYINICNNIFSYVEKAPIVISCTSFPKIFNTYDGVREIPIGSRSLFREVSQRFNNERIIYGDWASTKPRSSEMAGLPKPRIDYALGDKWVIARHWVSNNADNWEYSDAAGRLIASEYWPSEVRVWGEMRIEQTARRMPFSIDNPAANVASRINIHLHQQANFGREIFGTDDPWTDEL